MDTQELLRKAEMRHGWKESSFNVIEGLYGEEMARLVSKYFREEIPQAGNGMPSSYYNKLDYIPSDMKSKPEPAELARLNNYCGLLAGQEPNVKYIPLMEDRKYIFLQLNDCIRKVEDVEMDLISKEQYDFPEVRDARQALAELKEAIAKEPEMPALGNITCADDLREYQAKNTGGVFEREEGSYYDYNDILYKTRLGLCADIHKSVCRMEDIGTNLYNIIQEKLGAREAHLGYIEGHANKYHDGTSMFRDFAESIDRPSTRRMATMLVEMQFGQEDPYHEIARRYGALSTNDRMEFEKKSEALRSLFTSIEAYDRNAVTEKIRNMEWRDDHGKSIESVCSTIMSMNAKSLSLGEKARYSMGILQKDVSPEKMTLVEKSAGLSDMARALSVKEHVSQEEEVQIKAEKEQEQEKPEENVHRGFRR